MKKPRSFRPQVFEPLEERVVLSTAANHVATAFQQFEKQLLTHATSFQGTRLQSALVQDVNGLGRYVSSILGDTPRAKKLVREVITGAQQSNGTDLNTTATRGSLRAALFGGRVKATTAITSAEIKILKSL